MKKRVILLTMENDRLAIVYVAKEEKELTFLVNYGQTIEDLCIKVKNFKSYIYFLFMFYYFKIKLNVFVLKS